MLLFRLKLNLQMQSLPRKAQVQSQQASTYPAWTCA